MNTSDFITVISDVFNIEDKNCPTKKDTTELDTEIIDERNDDICSICNENKDEIKLSCKKMHGFCLDCIINWKLNKKIFTCPLCRKNCNYFVILPSNNISDNIKDFIELSNILPNPNKHNKNCICYDNEFENTSVYPVWLLELYGNNQKQLQLFKNNVKNYNDINELRNIIKWY